MAGYFSEVLRRRRCVSSVGASCLESSMPRLRDSVLVEVIEAVFVLLPYLCVQLYNNIYPFPLSQVVPLSQTALVTDPYQNTERSDQPDRGAQPARTNQTPACWAAREHQTETGITGRDGWSGPHRISQPIGGHPRNPPVRDRTTGGNRDEAVQGNRGSTGRTGGHIQRWGDILEKGGILQACINRGLKSNYSTHHPA